MCQAQTIDELVDAVRKAEGKSVSVAFDNLAARGNEALPALLTLIEDHKSSISHGAVEHAIKYRDPRVLPALIKLHQKLVASRNIAMGGTADKPYFMVNGKKATRALSKNIDTNSTLLAIGNHQNPNALKYLSKFANTNEKQTRFAVAYALGHIGNPNARPVLKKLSKDKVYMVRWQATDSLGKLNEMMTKYPKRFSDPNAWWKKPA
jgi:HEAT repeat protein